MLQSTGHVETDVAVSNLWPSTDRGESSHIKVASSDFVATLDNNAQTMRRTSILYVCSAFETALSNYYALCALYSPRKVSTSSTHTPVPQGLVNRLPFRQFSAWAHGKAAAALTGKYSKRVQTLNTTFAMGLDLAALPQTLDDWYERRHIIAHDQGLVIADDFEKSAQEKLISRVQIDEASWKTMLSDFKNTIQVIDTAIQSSVVNDKGVCFAVANYIAKPGSLPIRIGELRLWLAKEWAIEVSNTTIETTARLLGRSVSGPRTISRREIT